MNPVGRVTPVEPEGPRASPAVRPAVGSDVPAIRRFGEAVIPTHYAPLVGSEAAERQLRAWWHPEGIEAAVAAGLVVLAVSDGDVVGVGEWGQHGAEPVIYKLYVRPGYRGEGLGPQLIDALVRQLPAGTERVQIEHFAANVRAGEFYQREGFRVRRVEQASGVDRGLDVVWRVRDLEGGRRS